MLSDRVGLQFAAEDDELGALIEEFSDAGNSLETLEYLWVDDDKAWRTSLRIVDAATDLARTWLVVRLLGNLFNVARARYVEPGPVRLHILNPEISPMAISERSPSKGTVLGLPIEAIPMPPDQGEAVADRIQPRPTD